MDGSGDAGCGGVRGSRLPVGVADVGGQGVGLVMATAAAAMASAQSSDRPGHGLRPRERAGT